MSIGTALGVASGMLGGVLGFAGQNATNRANLANAREQMRFQERMSNTAVSRRMADMRRAGINPLLAGQYDASTPAGAMATFGNPGAAAASGFSQMGTTANTIATGGKQRELLEIQRELTENKEKITSIVADVSQTLQDYDWSSMAEQFRDDFNTFGAVVVQAIQDGVITIEGAIKSLRETADSYGGTAKSTRDNIIMRLLDVLDTWNPETFNRYYNEDF